MAKKKSPRSSSQDQPDPEPAVATELAPDSDQSDSGQSDSGQSDSGQSDSGQSDSGQPEPPDTEQPEAVQDAIGEAAAAEAELAKQKQDAAADAALEAGGGAGDKLSSAELKRAVCALVFASHDSVSVSRLASLLERPKASRLRKALEAIRADFEKSKLPIELREISGGWQLFTTPDQDEVVARLARIKKDDRVSPAALETLAVIAYRQPVMKAEIEAIRGVQAGPILRTLVDRGFVRVTGRAEVPGQPLLYGTTKKFLDSFGLANLKELPRDGELVRD